MPSNPYTDPVMVSNTSAEYAEGIRQMEYAPDGGNLPDYGQTSEQYGQQRPADPYAPTIWGQPTEYDFQAPSGQLCRMRKLDVIELMETNLINQVDFLTGTVQKDVIPKNRAARRAAAERPAEAPEEDAAKILETFKKNPEKTGEFLGVLEEIVIRAVVRPKIYPLPEEGSPLVPGRVYINSVEFNDKIAIFNKAMEGVGKLQNFRQEAEESKRVVEDGKGV
jgi:hypothetical protein